MALPVAPSPPAGSYPVPTWSFPGNIADPGVTKRGTGWVNVLGQNYGEIPPYKWENWMKYVTGLWIQYENNYINYIAQAGIAVWTASPLVPYQAGSIVQDGAGTIYRSLVDGNTNPLPTAPLPQASWTAPQVGNGFNVGTFPRAGLIKSSIVNLSTTNPSDGASLSLVTAPSSGPGPTILSLTTNQSSPTYAGPAARGSTDLSNNDPLATFNVNLNVSSGGVVPVMQCKNNGVVNFPFGIAIAGSPLAAITQIVTRVLTIADVSPYVPSSPSLKYITVEVLGGGGGGAGGEHYANGANGGGGGAGAYSKGFFVAAALGGSVPFSIGAGGGGGDGGGPTDGANGGASSFGSLIVNVGGGGHGIANITISSPAINGGLASTSTTTAPNYILNTDGNSGTLTNTALTTQTAPPVYGGGGASSQYGMGGRPILRGGSGRFDTSNSTGNPGSGFGAGGGGGGNFDVGPSNGGGVGTPGMILITEYI